MDIANNLTGFFYNLLPGTYFILLIAYSSRSYFNLYRFFRSNDGSVISIIVFISLALLVGFVFQGLTKIIRTSFLDEKVIKSVIADNNKGNLWKKVNKILIKRKLISKDSKEDIFQVFYLMDNHLNSTKTNILPTHFSSRTSLWANLIWANLFLTLIYFFSYYLIFFISFLTISVCVTWLNLKGQQDAILKSFLMLETSKK